MRPLLRVVLRGALSTGIVLIFLTALATKAATYTWQVTGNKNWNNAANWSPSGSPTTVAGDVVDASTFDLTAAATFNLDNGTTTLDRTVGTIIFGDTNASNSTTFNWTVSANGGAGSNPKLILATVIGSPTIQINNGTTTMNVVLDGTQGFSKTGAGTLLLANAGNTISGGITLSAGTLAFATGALNNNTITVAGTSALTWNTAGDVTDLSGKIILGNGSTLTLNLSGGATDNTVFASTIATSGGNAGGIVKANGGILTITVPQVYTGGTRVNNGRLVLTGGDDRLSTAGAITLGSGANSGVVQLGSVDGPSNQTITGITISGTGTANAFVGGSAINSVLTINNAAAIGAASSPIFGGSGTNENNLALVKTGAGSLSLAKSNTFAGDVTLNGGALVVTNNNSLGVGPKTVTVSGGVNAPSLQLNNGSGVALASNISFVTSNDNSAAPAILNVAGNNVVGGNITLADGGFGGGQTRIKVNAGSLTLNGAITAAATASSDRTLFLDGAANGTVLGSISDNGTVKTAVTKQGAGTWTLSAANSYSGNTTVGAGRLNITTAQTGIGAITVADGATLGVTLTGPGQTLAPSTLTLNHVTAGTALAFDLGGASNPATPLISTAVFTTAGAGANVIDISGTGLSIGTFDLINYVGSIGGSGFAGLALGNTPARVTANLVDSPGKVQLAITAFDIPKWTGAISGDWDVNDEPDPTTGIGTVNWKEANSGNPTRYLQFGTTVDSVLFDDSATGTTTVNLTTSLSPNSVTVNNSLLTYTFTGSGRLTGAMNLLKTGTGTLILANNIGNDFTGTTTINGGTLQIGDGVTFDAGQLGSGNIVIGAAGTLTLNRAGGAGQDLALANPISGTGTIIQQGGDIVTLSGNSSGFDGAIQVASGTLKVGSANALGSTVGGTTVSSGATLDITGFAIAENVALKSGTLQHLSGTSSLSGNVSLVGGGLIDSVAGTLTISGHITGAGGLTKIDAGNLVLAGSNNFTGPFISNGGTVTLAKVNTFDGGLTVNGGTVILAANQAYSGGTIITQGTLQIGGSNSATSGNVGSGDIFLNPGDGLNATLNILRGDNALNITNNITSSGAGTNSVTIGATGTTSASGIVTFSGINTFTGNVTINGGALKITNSNALGVGPKTVNVQANSRPALLLDGSTGNITLAAGMNFNLSSDGSTGTTANNPGGLVNLAGDNVINGNVAVTNGGGGNGKIVVNAGTLTLNGQIDATGATGVRTLLLGGAGSGTVNGVIADWFDDGAGANRVISVSKDGTGIWTLNGANTYTGATTVNGGAVIVSGALNGTASVAVKSGGTIGGAGSIATSGNGSVTVSSGGGISPGDGSSDSGTLTLALGTGHLDVSAAVGGIGWLHFDLGVSSDQITLTSGTLNIGTGLQLSDFDFEDASGFGPGTYVLFDTNNAITGVLGTNVSGTVLGFQTTLEFGDGGNDLVLNVVPEPASSVAILAGAAMLLSWNRFRRRPVRAAF